MTFTGTLIDDLMATVERAELRAQSDQRLTPEPMLVLPMHVETVFAKTNLVEGWIASFGENADYDSRLIGVA
jgi:hypothetical protein